MREQPLRYFELQLLQDLGYGPVLDRDIATGKPVVPDSTYDYRPDRGPVELRDQGLATPSRGLRLHGETLLGLARQRLESSDSLRESKRLMRALLADHLGMEPLHSRLLMQRALGARNRLAERVATGTPCADVAVDD